MESSVEARGTARDLIEAAIDLFGAEGYEAVSTRALSARAGTNVSSIRYHFGGKEELYVATLDHVVATVGGRLDGVLAIAGHVRELVGDDRARQAQLVRELVPRVLDAFLTHPDVRRFLPLVLRELLIGGRHLDRIYEALPRRLHETLTELVAWIGGEDPESPRTIVRTHALVGPLMVFHLARPILLRRLGRDDLGAEELDLVREEVTRLFLRALDLEDAEHAPRS